MPSTYLNWQSDFVVSATGGLLLANGLDYANQRIIRRICTAVQGYVWHPEYGAGLPQKIGGLYLVPQIQALVASQIALESSVAPYPTPVITVVESPNTQGIFTVTIVYTVAANGTPATLTFTLPT